MFKSKKAAGDAASTLILFIAVVGISVGLVVSIKNYAFETQESLAFQNKVVNNQLKTSIQITNVYYNESGQRIHVYLKNIGETRLVTESFDLFIDEAYIADFNVTEPNDFTENKTTLNIQETAAFVTNIVLNSGSHEVKLVSGYGGSGDSESFNT
jgi:archaellum component FlaF (FlaF/FlaG flagellin family)